jgi:ABC-type Fe3+-hydroxamate transport system substrate-binding protein
MITKSHTKSTKHTKNDQVLLLFFLTFLVFMLLVPTPWARSAERPTRIVSLIPAITEMLFAMDAGPQVVAVSSFDEFPPEAQKLPRVGALVDPDLERILSLRPDLVAIYGSQTDLRTQLERAGVPLYIYRHAGLADIAETIRALGARVGRPDAAAALARNIDSRLAAIRARTAGRPRPRTLIVMGREALSLRGIYASGGVGFIHDMVEAAGGTNVFADVKKEAVQATTELVLSRRPDVILELRLEPLSPGMLKRERDVWNGWTSVPAVKNGHVYLITDDRTIVPGPRVAEGVELIANALDKAR